MINEALVMKKKFYNCGKANKTNKKLLNLETGFNLFLVCYFIVNVIANCNEIQPHIHIC